MRFSHFIPSHPTLLPALGQWHCFQGSNQRSFSSRAISFWMIRAGRVSVNEPELLWPVIPPLVLQLFLSSLFLPLVFWALPLPNFELGYLYKAAFAGRYSGGSGPGVQGSHLPWISEGTVTLEESRTTVSYFILCIYLFFCLFAFSRATPAAYGSQARGPIRAVAAGLCHSHSNAGSKPCL